MSAGTPPSAPRWTRRYPPFALLALGLFFAATLLPSVLNITQPTPSQTLEYAPVAQEGEERVPPGGSLGFLGLGSGQGLGRTGGGIAQEAIPTGQSRRPSTKRCVGSPPRQSEDPLAPPCVAFFEGNNFGATHQGVTMDEVRILVYQDGYEDDDYGPYEEYECGRFTDLGEPPRPGDPWSFPYLRAYQRYFNERYQTYNRFVHLIVQSSNCQYSAEARRADAQTGFAKVKPFAVFPYVVTQNQEAFMEAMADRDVVSFFTPTFAPTNKSFLQRYPGFIYSFGATTEVWADLYASYVCSKIVGFPVSYSGNSLDTGPRRIGQLYADDSSTPELRLLSEIVAREVEKCGGKIELTRTVPWGNTFGATIDDPVTPSQVAASNMAAFKTDNITTVLWTGMTDISHSRAAAAIDYRPEWLVVGIGNMDTNTVATLQDSSVWRNAWVFSQATFSPELETEMCYLAAKEGDPNADLESAETECIYSWPQMRLIFTGIQVAGPRLNPRTLDEGFHAIPRIASTNPRVPACFYDPGDYSCVKDAHAEWWDPGGSARSSTGTQPGCYRVTEKGKRFLARTWPRENVNAKKTSGDLCNNYGAGGF